MEMPPAAAAPGTSGQGNQLKLSLGYNLFLGVKPSGAAFAALNGIDNGKLRVAGLLQTDEIAAVEDRSSQDQPSGLTKEEGHDAARFTALVRSRCCLAVRPVRRRGRILPRSVMNFFSRSTSL